jgi:hypothetical protein
LFLKVHRPLRNDYVSVEELVRETPTTSRVSFNTFLLSTKAIFSIKRQGHNPHELAVAHHNLGN